MTIGQKIQSLRRQRGWSQEMLAEQLHVSRQALSKWELGTSVPDTENLLKLSKLFAVSTDYLLDDTISAPEDNQPQNTVQAIAARFKISERAKRNIAEKGYIACYILIGRDILALLVLGLICYAYLSSLSGAVSLQMFSPELAVAWGLEAYSGAAFLQKFPPQAFIMPIVACIIGVFIIARIIIFLLLAIKIRRSQSHN